MIKHSRQRAERATGRQRGRWPSAMPAAGSRLARRAAVGAAAAVLCVIAGAGAAQAQVTAPSAQAQVTAPSAPAKVAAPGPARPAHLPAAKRVNLHQRYLAQLRGVKAGKIAGIVRPRGWHSAAAGKVRASCTEPDCPLTYHGGPVQHHPQVYLVFWGPNWDTDPGQQATEQVLIQFYADLGGIPQDTWSPITSQYGDGTGFPQIAGGVVRDALVDTSTPPTGATPSQLATEATTAGSYFAGQGYTIGANSQIVVATQSGTCPLNFASPSCPPPAPGSGYCGWHNVVTGGSFTNLPFVNLPYLLDAGTFCYENVINPGSAGTYDGFSVVGGHEFAEAVTDPVPGAGWWDSGDTVSGGEIGDKCAIGQPGNPPKGDVTLGNGDWAMQSLWSNGAGGCALADLTEDGVSITNPGTQTSGAGGFVDLQMAGSATSGDPLEWTATGLPPGVSISDSGLITGTPTTTGDYTADVSASDATGGTGGVAFGWNVLADTVTVTNPGNQTSYANAQVSLQMSGSSSAGFTPLSWSSADLPADLFVNGATGLIYGQVPHASTYPITVTAKDAGGVSGSASFAWTVKPDVGKPVKENSAGVCLNDNGSVTTAGNPVNVWKCNGSGAQKWVFSTTATGKLTVFGMCLSDPNSGGTGTKLVLSKCSTATSDTWTHNSSNEYVLKLNGLCLTDPNDSKANGTQVTLTKCAAATSQLWALP